MEFIADQLNGSGNICILKGIESHPATVSRTQAYLDVLEDYPGITVLDSQFAGFDRTQAETQTAAWIATHSTSIDAIIANNDTMILGARDALATAGITDVFLVGLDGTQDVIAAIADGSVDASVSQAFFPQGEFAIENIVKVLHGQNVDKKAYVPPEIITASNVSEYQ